MAVWTPHELRGTTIAYRASVMPQSTAETDLKAYCQVSLRFHGRMHSECTQKFSIGPGDAYYARVREAHQARTVPPAFALHLICLCF